MTMGLAIYKESLLLLTNASEDVIIKSKARELFLHYKTYKVRQNKQNSRKPLYSGHLQTMDTRRSSQAVRYMEVPLYYYRYYMNLNIFEPIRKVQQMQVFFFLPN